MKRIVIVLLILFIAFGILACNGTREKEFDNIPNNDEISLEKEKVFNESNYDKISAFMEEESRNAFSPYYELLDFQISDYQEEIVDGNVESIFFYRIISKNYNKNPDTVGYIKDAKESRNKNYQQMYDEYLQPREMNFHLKVVMEENDLMTLYSNIAPKGIEWEETKMTDFILTR